MGKEKVEEGRVHEVKSEIGGERKQLLQGGTTANVISHIAIWPCFGLIAHTPLMHTFYAQASRYFVMFQASGRRIRGIYDRENS